MRHRPLTIALLLAACAGTAYADEGMWMPSQLPSIAKELRAAGFRGNPADLASGMAGLLSPVLHILPKKDVNISMGYPLARSALARVFI